MSVSKKRKRKSSKPIRKTSKPSATRNAALDALRGVAIVLMIVDHVAWAFFEQPIEFPGVRFWTRLSMPLFCVLAGYFLVVKPQVNWARITQVALAAAVVNLGFFTTEGQLEILASLLVCFLAYALVGRWFMLAIVAAAVFSVDPSRVAIRPPAELFDYAISLVASVIALGMLQRKFGLRVTLPVSLGLCCASLWIAAPSVYVLYFTPLAVLLMAGAEKLPSRSWGGLEWVGRYPLSIYVAHYLLVLLLKE